MRLHEHPIVVAAHAEVQRVAAELARYEGRHAELRDNAPRPGEMADLARRILAGGAPDPMDDIEHVGQAVAALRRALAEARLAAEQAELEVQREYRAEHAPSVAASDRALLAALEALHEVNEARRALNVAAELAGFDPLLSAGFEPEAVAACIEQRRREVALSEALAAAKPGEVRRVRLLVAHAGRAVGDVLDLPAAEAARWIHARQAEAVPATATLVERVKALVGWGEPALE